MVANNPYLIPQVEEVKYLNNEVPTYEEFLRNYKVDERVKNSYESETDAYNELVKGYGPCYSCSESNRNLTFKLKIILKNIMGGWRSITVHSTNDARKVASDIRAERDHWENKFLDTYSGRDRQKLFDKIYSKIEWHEKGNEVDSSVCNKEERRSMAQNIYEGTLEREGLSHLI